MNPLVALFLGGTILTLGDIVFKRWLLSNTISLYVLGIFLYVVGANFLVYTFKYKEIAVASVIFIVFNVVTLMAAGYWLFGESLSSPKIVGIVLALAAVILMEMA